MSEVALYKALVSAGVPEAEAREAVDGLARAQDVATKSDQAQLETHLKSRIDQGESRLESRLDQLESRLEQLKSHVEARIAQLESRLIRWMVASWLATVVAIASILQFLPAPPA